MIIDRKNKTPVITVLILFTFLVWMPGSSPAQGHDFGRSKEKSPYEPSMLSPIHLFQKYISNIDGNRCPMYPSCSAYSMDAFKKHGPVIGWIMTCDRLMRCGRDEKELSPPVKKSGSLFTYDPVTNNDFWWRAD